MKTSYADEVWHSHTADSPVRKHTVDVPTA